MKNLIEKKIIILDDHPMYLLGLKKIINDDPGFSVLDCCRTTSELLFALSIVKADIVILDLSQPDGESDIKKLVSQLHDEYPDIMFVAMGENRRHQTLSLELKPKIKRYFCKTLTGENILSGLHHLHNPELVTTSKPEIMQNSEFRFAKQKSLLSAREKFIIEYLHAGLTVSQVAQRINRSVKTVSAQKRTAMRKLGITQERDIFQLKLSDI